MTQNGYVTGNWGADWRVSGDAVGAQTQMAQLGWALQSGDEINLRFRTLQNQPYAASVGFPTVDYRRADMMTLEYAQPRDGYTRGLQLDFGRDVYGGGYARLAAFLRLDGGSHESARDYSDGEADEDIDEDGEHARVERFVDLGVSGGRLGLDYGGFSAAQEAAAPQYRNVISPHLGIGVRKQVSANQDLGVRAELDDFNSRPCWGCGSSITAIASLGSWRSVHSSDLRAMRDRPRRRATMKAQGYNGAIYGHTGYILDARLFDHLQRDKILPAIRKTTIRSSGIRCWRRAYI